MQNKIVAALLAAFAFSAFVSPIAASAEVVSGTVNALVGGTAKSFITSTSAQTCTSLEVNATGYGRLVALFDASGSGQTATITLYDEGASPTCAAADAIYAAQVLTAQVITLGIPLTAGLAYKLSGAAVSNLVITRN